MTFTLRSLMHTKRAGQSSCTPTAAPLTSVRSRMRWEQHMLGQFNMSAGLITLTKLLVDTPTSTTADSLTLRPLIESDALAVLARARVELHAAEQSALPP